MDFLMTKFTDYYNKKYNRLNINENLKYLIGL